MKFRLLTGLEQISPEEWNSLDGAQTPFTRFEFLNALESSGCVAPVTGWQPRHLVWEHEGELRAALPLYLKHHSYGEYVFDWSWAEAYQQAGGRYYPKLLCAIPFTPVPGPRLLTAFGVERQALLSSALTFLRDYLDRQGLSSLHLLFPDNDLCELLEGAKLLRRQSTNFIWHNQGYRDFDDFLAGFRSAKRKQVRRERKRIAEQGVELQRLVGDEIDGSALDFFLACYQDTYLKRSGHRGYLNKAFFESLLDGMRDQLMLVVARQDHRPVASALFFFDQWQLSGRYWGALRDIDCLHFEVCYYQGIEFCIEREIEEFNPGTQGEHKLLRGFVPARSSSYHWIRDPALRDAVQRSLTAEKTYQLAYESAARRHLPFKNG